MGEAKRRWESTIRLTGDVADSQENLELGVMARARLARIAFRLGAEPEESEALADEARILAERGGDAFGQAHAVCAKGFVMFGLGQLDRSLGFMSESVRLFQEMGDPEASAVRALIAYPLSVRGPLSTGLAYNDEAAELALRYPEMGERLFGLSVPDYNYFWRAWLLARMGRFEDAGRAATLAAAAGRERSVLELVAWALPVHSLVAFLTGQGKGAVGRASEAVGVADELGSPFHSVLALEGLGAACLAAGRGEDALPRLHDALALARDRHVGLFEESSLLAYLADASVQVGDEAAALQAAEEAVAVAREQAARVHECQALLARARALRSTAGLDAGKAIAADLTEASAAIEEVGAHAWSPFLHEERARLARLEGDGPTEERQLREAHRLFVAIGASGHAARLTKELG